MSTIWAYSTLDSASFTFSLLQIDSNIEPDPGGYICISCVVPKIILPSKSTYGSIP